MTTPSAVESMNVAPPMSRTTTGCELAAPIVRMADSWGAAATSSSPEAVTRCAWFSGSCSISKSMARTLPSREGEDAQPHAAHHGQHDGGVAAPLPGEQHTPRDVDRDRQDEQHGPHRTSVS